MRFGSFWISNLIRGAVSSSARLEMGKIEQNSLDPRIVVVPMAGIWKEPPPATWPGGGQSSRGRSSTV